MSWPPLVQNLVIFCFYSLFRCAVRQLLIINYFSLEKILYRSKRKIDKQMFS